METYSVPVALESNVIPYVPYWPDDPVPSVAKTTPFEPVASNLRIVGEVA